MKALTLTEKLPERLQATQRNAILSLLGERLLAWLEEMEMNTDKIPMSPAALRVKAKLEAHRAALLAYRARVSEDLSGRVRDDHGGRVGHPARGELRHRGREHHVTRAEEVKELAAPRPGAIHGSRP